jgi:hypothetical protein
MESYILMGVPQFPSGHGRQISGILIHGDHSRICAVRGYQSLFEKSFGCLSISVFAQHEFNSIAFGIYRPVKVSPVPLDLDIGFIDPVRVVGRLQVGTASFIQIWSIFMDPTVDCGMGNFQSPLKHHPTWMLSDASIITPLFFCNRTDFVVNRL